MRRHVAGGSLVAVLLLTSAAPGAVGVGDRPPHPDGLIVFSCTSCTNGQGPAGVFTIRPDGRGLRKLPRAVGSEPAWSPDGRSLALTRDDGVWLSAADGSKARQVTHRHPRGYDAEPSWSPDGTQLVFARGTPRGVAVGGLRHGLWTVPVRGGPPRPLLVAPAGPGAPEWSIGHPDWSPDGGLVAFGFGRERLRVVRPDGTRVRRLGPLTVRGREPHWSPDGGRIAFLRLSDDGPHRFRILDLATDRVRTVFASEGEVQFQAWSPDGRWLAIAATRRVECEDVVLGDECHSLDLWLVDATNARRTLIHSFGQEGSGVTGIDWRAQR